MSSVDVVIPCYNYAHYLPFAVESALNQRDVDVRVLILDDQSPDNTAEVGARLAAADARISYVRNERNLGLIGTANKGLLDWAAADYCVLLSADDAMAPGAFSRAATIMNARPDVHLAFGRALLISEESTLPPLGDQASPTFKILDGKAFVRWNFENGNNPTPSPTVVVRTAMQKRLGGYLPQLKHTSDMEMWMRFACNGPVAAVRQVQAYYRLHSGNMSGAYNAQALRDRREIIEACSIVADSYSSSLPELRGWLDALKRRFADEAFWLAGHALAEGDKATMDERLDFAQAWHPSPNTSSAAWKFRIKQMLGSELVRKLTKTDRDVEAQNGDAGAYRARAGEVGWWPGE